MRHMSETPAILHRFFPVTHFSFSEPSIVNLGVAAVIRFLSQARQLLGARRNFYIVCSPLRI